ncbi:exonuclease mut-7 homolog isoform X1 [Bos javanicus]|uniref:exonuclease mut-7 homolog isoform X1 n=2 Tax=Bos javanicus TaxID=9906 RepID=UPI002AA8B84B|nr:exonuclease mut-7 homolog isoform X1 [Bos javanicus]XP_061290282.1 exonuclease mut-7 homolog isoform X1 [Bos javanicus]
MDPGDPEEKPAAGDPAGGQDPRLFLQTLQTLWSIRELRQLREEAWKWFAALDNPLTTLLDMLDASRGCGGRDPSLEAWVARELERWLQAQPHPGPAQGGRALKPLQARAVRLLTEGPPSLVEPLVSIFQLQDADRSPVLAHIHRLHQEGKFKEAIVLGTKLQLQADLDVEKMCVPLLLQDKVDLAERYVDSLPHLQQRLLALMDSWCQPGFDIRVVARQYPQVTLRLERLSPRALGRHVLRLLEQYSLDPALCPNAVTQQRLAALRYLCYKRLVERSMSQESWAELVQGLVGQDECLQEQLLQLLASLEDVAMVAQCALDLSLPVERLPATVVAEMSQLRLQERTAKAPSEDRRDDCYQLPISRDDIYFLASWEELARHEDTLLQPGQAVGVDLEWRPSFGAGGRPRVSLMQVAVQGRVFLLDLPRLSSPAGGQGPRAFSQLVSQLLSDPSITKLGYGMAGDLRSLGTSYPALAQAGQKLQGGLDLLQVHRQMRVADRPAPAVDGAAGPRGLSLLVQQVLGKPLDKTQQLSNWDRRPLGEGQLVYAAADAYCLLEVYWALCREPARFHLPGALPWSLRLGRSERHGTWEPPLQQASASPWQVLSPEDAAPEVPARAFRVVCDSMLGGLGRTLRCLGVDVRVLHSGEDHRQAAEVARQEGRVILTSGLPYHKLRAQVGAGRCLAVDCSLKAQQQAKAILRHFNVRVTPADIFSRCQACNCDQYLKVSKDMMKQLVRLSVHLGGPGGASSESSHSDGEQETDSAPEEAPGHCSYDPPCRWLEDADLQTHVPATLANGTRLQLAGVPAGVLRRPGLQHFYCCPGCGKVFWEGTHLARVTSNFQEILKGAPRPASGPS